MNAIQKVIDAAVVVLVLGIVALGVRAMYAPHPAVHVARAFPALGFCPPDDGPQWMALQAMARMGGADVGGLPTSNLR